MSLSNKISSYKMIFTTKATKIFLVVQWDGSYEVNINNGDFVIRLGKRMVGM